MPQESPQSRLLALLLKKSNILIGGSADLAGSNNTKTKYHEIIKPGNFNGNYIHYGVENMLCVELWMD